MSYFNISLTVRGKVERMSINYIFWGEEKEPVGGGGGGGGRGGGGGGGEEKVAGIYVTFNVLM